MYNWPIPFLQQLATSHEVVIFDNPGVGNSTAKVANITIPYMADATLGLIKALSLSAPVVLGYSMGGTIAATAAVTKGSSLSHIVMLSSTAGGAATWFDPITNGSILSFPILGKRNPNAFVDLIYPAGKDDKALCENLAASAAFAKAGLHIAAISPKTLDQQLIALDNYFRGPTAAYPKLRGVSNKFMYVHGSLDHALPVRNAYLSAAQTPAADVVVVDGAGHAVQDRDPIGTANLVLDFIKRAPAKVDKRVQKGQFGGVAYGSKA
ncbi:hypothetical protein MNEG_8473 [Monoraphidium neglectum]|uniref:AB hydrolase-1 domain-containing protein n=1 Tax=Monoraphidium neglectum TaxID=145388 RepID=A0A0D2MZD3_9CHLO|nr:hypothetical protein MNEG_8473 [Monoraphidium neglectum]KIY99490.1 hypothetical protein MNEG_8473 [Monoraphidium neglectum]|eukprot:XP_013898510.1 hypothetical protein MNEG_8473 [Monoraphidium neglectum]